MSSAAVQPSAPAISNRQYQQSPHTREQYYAEKSPSSATSSSAARKTSRTGNGTSPHTPTHHAHSPADSNASSLTPRAQPPQPATTSASSMASSYGTTSAGPPIEPPPRTSSHHRTQTATASASDYESARSSASRSAQSSIIQGNAFAQQQTSTAATTDAAQSRRRAHQSPKDGSSSSRGKPSPAHSRSQNEMNQPPMNTDLPREESTIINRLVITDPQEDIAREEARVAESRPVRGGETMADTGLALVGPDGVEDGGRGGGKSRSEKTEKPRKETRFGDYILGQTLGEGEFGKVKMGWKRDGGVQVAIKLIRRETLGNNPSRLPKIYREIAILRGLQHPNIVRLHEMVETERHIGIILEYASGGELFDYILQHRFLKENAARRLFAQLVSGVGYLHKKGIVHRDLKLENLLLDRNRNIIITDFGFANTFSPNDELTDEIEYRLGDREFVKKMGLEQVDVSGHRRGDLMQTSCGSPCYAAPELVVSDSLYTGRKVDVWSCGVILYAMLAGYLPFDDDPANPEGDNINLLYKYIVSTPLTFPEYVTPHARDLLKRILVPDPRKRADLFEVARHSWLSEYAHVVAFITSNTTSPADIANTTVPAEDALDVAPLLARSASVREPSKPHAAPTTLGGLAQKHGQVDQPSEKKPTRDKRRTVQVEYVEPKSSTARGEGLSTSSGAAPGTSKTRPRDQGPVEVASSGYTQPVQSPTTSMPPPARPTRDQQRAASENVMGTSTIMPVPSGSRPATGGSLSGARLPSRGNSYGQPAIGVATEQAQGSFSQPKGTQYNIASGRDVPDGASYGQPYIQRPVDEYRPATERREPSQQKSHRRSNTIGERLGTLFGRNSISADRKLEEKDSRPKKSHPPISMKQPMPVNNNEPAEPRRSTDSSRKSFSFSRKNSNQREDGSQRSSRRFSLIPASLQRTFSNSHKEPQVPSTAGSGDRHASYRRTREDSRPRFGFGQTSRSPSRSTTAESIPVIYDAQLDRNRDGPSTQRISRVPAGTSTMPISAPPQQTQFQSYRGQDPFAGYNTSRPIDDLDNDDTEEPPPPPPKESTPNRQTQTLTYRHAQYPTDFNGYEDNSYSPQLGRDKPATLQKHRRFTEAYENDHSGSSGPAKRVMDFFRKRGKARAGE